MKSPSSFFSSCLGSLLLMIGMLLAIRYGIPGLWSIIVGISKGAVVFGGLLFLALFLVLGYFTIKNLKKNKNKTEEKKYARVTRVQELYRSVSDRLQKDILLNQVSAEEILQAEVLVSDRLSEMKTELVRLLDFSSPTSRKLVETQTRDYRRQLQSSTDPSVRQVIQENLDILAEKKERMESAENEIRQKEAMIDLLYNSLLRVDEDLRLGRIVQRLLPAEVYSRFGLTPPSDQLPPLGEKSSLVEK